MTVEEKLMNDQRFYIDRFSFERHLKISKMLSYSIEFIEVGNILRYQGKKIFNIKYSDVYSYLENRDEKEYQKYCENICVGEDYYKHSIKIYKKLIKEMKKTDYNIKKGAIVVNQLNIIMDGQHRACILLNKYGEKYKIPVVKIRYKKLGLFTYFNYFKYLLFRR